MATSQRRDGLVAGWNSTQLIYAISVVQIPCVIKNKRCVPKSPKKNHLLCTIVKTHSRAKPF